MLHGTLRSALKGTTHTHAAAWSLVVFGLLLLTFCLGLPQFHYAVAVMIAVILRYKDEPLGQPLFRFGFSASDSPHTEA